MNPSLPNPDEMDGLSISKVFNALYLWTYEFLRGASRDKQTLDEA